MLYAPKDFPYSARVALTMGQMYTLSVSSASVQTFTFQTGKQPLIVGGTLAPNEPQGWDKWKVLYNFYRVLGMKVYFEVTPVDANPEIVLDGTLMNLSTYLGSSDGEASNNTTKVRMIGNNTTKGSLYFNWRSGTPLGMSKEQWRTDNTTLAAMPTLPVTKSFLNIVIRNHAPVAKKMLIRWRAKMYFSFENNVIQVDA